MTSNENPVALLLHFEQRYPGCIAGMASGNGPIVGIVARDLAETIGRLRSLIMDSAESPTISSAKLVSNLVDHHVGQADNLEAKLVHLAGVRLRSEVRHEPAFGASWTVLRVAAQEAEKLADIDDQSIVDAYWTSVWTNAKGKTPIRPMGGMAAPGQCPGCTEFVAQFAAGDDLYTSSGHLRGCYNHGPHPLLTGVEGLLPMY